MTKEMFIYEVASRLFWGLTYSVVLSLILSRIDDEKLRLLGTVVGVLVYSILLNTL